MKVKLEKEPNKIGAINYESVIDVNHVLSCISKNTNIICAYEERPKMFIVHFFSVVDPYKERNPNPFRI